MELLMCKGLPASGKSTYAKNLVLVDPSWVEVNKDEIREEFGYTFEEENKTLQVRNDRIRKAFEEGRNVISSDTNFHPKHEKKLREIAAKYGAKFSIESFLNVSIFECIERDSKREKPVGEKVIWGMHNQYCKNQNVDYIDMRASFLPDVWIFDVDGTLALSDGRSPFDASKYLEDFPNYPVVKVAQALWNQGEAKIIIVSGREGTEKARQDTITWLDKMGIFYNAFFMRKEGDKRRDSIIKREIYLNNIKDKYNVLGVFDDRPHVIHQAWSSLQLFVFDVGPNFDF